jgi:hypothetical protein
MPQRPPRRRLSSNAILSTKNPKSAPIRNSAVVDLL